MAPIRFVDSLVDMYSSLTTSRQLVRRTAPSESLIATIVVVSVASTLFIATLIFLSVKIWKKMSANTCTNTSDTDQDQAAAAGRKQSDWARKNSNVLWSMYPDEDDLKTQFALSPKSRLFSIGSVSTVDHGRCPLDRRQSHGNPLKIIVEKQLPEPGEQFMTVDLRTRTPFEHQTTPTKTLPARPRASSQPLDHRQHDSFEEMAKRKQSVPMATKGCDNKGYDYYSTPCFPSRCTFGKSERALCHSL